jgi:hypothetical protein
MRAPSSWPLFGEGTAASYPELATDLRVLETELVGEFTRLDVAALRSQHAFRLAQVVLILGGLLATLLGTLQAALHRSAWAGIAEGVVVALLAAVFQLTSQLSLKQEYLEQRLRAERLRAEAYFYLARAGLYGDLAADAAAALLRRHVRLIARGQPLDV